MQHVRQSANAESAEPMTAADLRGLPLTVNIVTAGRAFGLGRDTSYRLARSGRFPCEVIRAGRRYLVTRAALMAALGIPDTATGGMPDPGNALATAISPQANAVASDTETVGGR